MMQALPKFTIRSSLQKDGKFIKARVALKVKGTPAPPVRQLVAKNGWVVAAKWELYGAKSTD